MGPCQFRNAWLKHEKSTGKDPDMSINIQFFLSLLLVRYFCTVKKIKIWGIQLNKLVTLRSVISEKLFVETSWEMWITLLKINKIKLIKKNKLYLSFRCFCLGL